MANHFPSPLDDVEVQSVQYNFNIAEGFSDSSTYNGVPGGTVGGPSIVYDVLADSFDQDAVETHIVAVLNAWSAAMASAFGIEESVVQDSISVQRVWSAWGTLVGANISESMTYPA